MTRPCPNGRLGRGLSLCPPGQKGGALGGEGDGKTAQVQVADKPQAQGGQAAAQVQMTGDDVGKAQADYEAPLKERDERIAVLEDEIAEAAKTAESAEKLRAEMDERRRKVEEQRVGFELQMAGARNVKAAKALLADYDKLRAA